MDQFTKEGRKLRPRKTSSTSSSFEKVEFNHERRSFGDGEHRSYGERKHRQYGEGRPSGNYGERRSYGDGERRSFGDGERRSYGERRPRQYGEGRPLGNYGERRSYGDGERRSFGDGERRSYGERKPHQYGEGRPSGNYGERRSYGDGERRSFGDGERRSYGERKSYGDRKPRQQGAGRPSNGGFGARRPKGRTFNDNKAFNKQSSEGINRMISRRPVINGSEAESSYDFPIKDTMRLNKFIANSGVCSRREADTLIQAGVVTVNGEVITELGIKVNTQTDDIRFNGERLKGEEKVYIIMNKPRGYVTTASDPHADKTVIDLVKRCPSRVYPVGRLDKNTTGVLMLTNDGEIAERLTHPSFDKKKIYQVAIDRDLKQEDFEKILSGIELSDGIEKADELEYIDENDKRKLGIEIHSGKNRIVRRLFESLGYNVKALDRVYFAGLTKRGLKKGEWRYLTEGEINILKMGAYV